MEQPEEERGRIGDDAGGGADKGRGCGAELSGDGVAIDVCDPSGGGNVDNGIEGDAGGVHCGAEVDYGGGAEVVEFVEGIGDVKKHDNV